MTTREMLRLVGEVVRLATATAMIQGCVISDAPSPDGTRDGGRGPRAALPEPDPDPCRSWPDWRMPPDRDHVGQAAGLQGGRVEFGIDARLTREYDPTQHCLLGERERRLILEDHDRIRMNAAAGPISLVVCRELCEQLPPERTRIPLGNGASDSLLTEFTLLSCDRTADELSCRYRSEGHVLFGLHSYVGRRPGGLTPPPAGDSPGAWLAEIATLEAASVIAFERLADSLRRFDAPDELVSMARRSAHDERRHARLISSIARQFGVEPQPPEITDVSEPDLESFAAENAVEGCVRETFGAAEAAWLAAHSPHAGLRFASRSIARDESRHAALAWRIDGWVRSLVRPELLDAAMGRELAHLAARPPYSDELVTTLGLPDALAARGLVEGLEQRLWRRAA